MLMKFRPLPLAVAAACLLVGCTASTEPVIDTACTTGSMASACTQLGEMYYKGDKIASDMSKAARYYERGCDLGDDTACNNLAVMYVTGAGGQGGVRQDFTRAQEFFRRACNVDNAMACRNLAGLYEAGRGVDMDYDLAREYYGKACTLGDASGCKKRESVGSDLHAAPAMGGI